MKIDMAGKTYGRLKVISESTRRGKSRDVFWTCICSCGRTVDVNGYSLRNGNSKSCGCLRIDSITKHGEGKLNKILDGYKRSAKKRGIKFQISDRYFKTLSRSECHYCGAKPSPFNGVDRVDSSYGYIKKNCVSCCSDCNQMKWTMTREKFINHVRKICKWNEHN